MYDKIAVKKYREKMKHNPDWIIKKRLQTRLSIELFRFGRPRIEFLTHFRYTCQKCLINYESNPKKLHIHHIDNQGRNVKKPNNELINFTILCSSCHAKKTWEKRHEFLRKNHIFPNSYNDIYGRPPIVQKDKITGKFISHNSKPYAL